MLLSIFNEEHKTFTTFIHDRTINKYGENRINQFNVNSPEFSSPRLDFKFSILILSLKRDTHQPGYMCRVWYSCPFELENPYLAPCNTIICFLLVIKHEKVEQNPIFSFEMCRYTLPYPHRSWFNMKGPERSIEVIGWWIVLHVISHAFVEIIEK